MNISDEAVEAAGKWRIAKVPSREGNTRPFIWEVACPDRVEEPSWANDFRPARCRCKRFRNAAQAERYVQKMKESAL